LSIGPAHVFATADAVGGVWTYAMDLAAAVAGRGIRTTLALHGPAPEAALRRQAAAIPLLRLVETGLPLDWTARTAEELLDAARALRRLAVASGADVVQLNSPVFAATAPYPMPLVGAVHSSLATWWHAVRDDPLPADLVWRTELLRAGMLACDALIAPSAAFADAVARIHHVDLPRVVHNGRATVPCPSRAERRRLVLTAGRLWDLGKNLAVLDRAAALIDAPLLAVGPLQGPNGERIALRHAQALGPRPSAALRALLAQAPIFASAALYEPFGLGVLEAAMAGCALVLSDTPTFRELWHGAAAFVAPRDAHGVAEVLQRLLDRPAEVLRLAAAARRRAASLTVAAMAEGTLEVYGAAASRHRQRAPAGAAA
jgi:glycosyltransferase involved in cell wall biosynthesis